MSKKGYVERREAKIKRRITLIRVLPLLGVFFTGCFLCPDDEFLGKVDLMKESWEYYPYSNIDALVFQNSEKDTLILNKRELLHDYNPSEISRPCYKTPLDQTNVFYSTEFLRVYYVRKIDTSYVSISYTLGVKNTEDFLNGRFSTVDMLSTSAQINSDAIGYIHLIINKREQTLDSISLKKKLLISPVQYQDSIILNDTPYYEVYSGKHYSGSEIFYTQAQGVIGFITDKGGVYNLADVIIARSEEDGR